LQRLHHLHGRRRGLPEAGALPELVWTQRASRATASLFPLASINVEFYAETYAGLGSPGVARYAYLNY
jgi:hypothetical protein